MKKIKGREYTYYQWTEDGKQRSRIVHGEEKKALETLIERRKMLEQMLKYGSSPIMEPDSLFRTNIRTGAKLDDFVNPVRKYLKREQFSKLLKYVNQESPDYVCILFGLRRTGKTTMMRQAIAEMDDTERRLSAYIQVSSSNTMADLSSDLKLLERLGYRYVFIDEVTLMGDFIQGAALLSDIYVASGMKIVLSGTDSLGFLFSEDEELYDRCMLLHTTFIPFREFSRVLGIKDIDRYIMYGGTMTQSGDDYNRILFESGDRTGEYVNTAIAENIQHSLKYYRNGSHFRSLKELYDNDELINVINRIVEDMNHEFALKVLVNDFVSHDFGSAKDIMRKDRENPTDTLDRVDEKKLTENIMGFLKIRNVSDRKTEIGDIHRIQIKEYLNLLDLIREIPVRDINDPKGTTFRVVFTQPGLRYSQSESLIKSLMMDETFLSVSADERKRITARILSDIKGRMLEEIILLETMMVDPDKQVFTLQFAVGEFDMVVFDPAVGSCQI
ncbi:MAG: AAA family ATPase, partial [Bullifex sp.]